MLSLPEHHLASETGETKSVFCAAMRGIVPDEILDRRDKVGCDTPKREWMRHRVLSGVAAKGRTESVALDLIRSTEMIQTVTQAFDSDKPFNWQVWRIFNLLAWNDKTIMPTTHLVKS